MTEHLTLPIVYSIEDVVRDAEVDMQGGLANFRYLEFAQHVRHTYLKSIGIDVNDLMPVVLEVHGKYLKMMGENDRYRLDLRFMRSGPYYHFYCDITNTGTGALSFMADQKILFVQDRKSIRRDVITEAIERDLNDT